MALTWRYADSGKNTLRPTRVDPVTMATQRVRSCACKARPVPGLASVWGSVPGSGVRRTGARPRTRAGAAWASVAPVPAGRVDVVPAAALPHPPQITSAARQTAPATAQMEPRAVIG